MYTIYDDIHSEYVADFATFDDAIDQLEVIPLSRGMYRQTEHHVRAGKSVEGDCISWNSQTRKLFRRTTSKYVKYGQLA